MGIKHVQLLSIQLYLPDLDQRTFTVEYVLDK